MIAALSHHKSLLPSSTAIKTHLRAFSTQAASLPMSLPVNWVIFYA